MTKIAFALWAFASVALRSTVLIVAAVLLIMVLLPVALGAVGPAAQIGR